MRYNIIWTLIYLALCVPYCALQKIPINITSYEIDPTLDFSIGANENVFGYRERLKMYKTPLSEDDLYILSPEIYTFSDDLSHMTVDGRTFRLLYLLVFIGSSQHMVNGTRGDMSVWIVHTDLQQDYAILEIMYAQVPEGDVEQTYPRYNFPFLCHTLCPDGSAFGRFPNICDSFPRFDLESGNINHDKTHEVDLDSLLPDEIVDLVRHKIKGTEGAEGKAASQFQNLSNSNVFKITKGSLLDFLGVNWKQTYPWNFFMYEGSGKYSRFVLMFVYDKIVKVWSDTQCSNFLEALRPYYIDETSVGMYGNHFELKLRNKATAIRKLPVWSLDLNNLPIE